jgi:hypothetical protein
LSNKLAVKGEGKKAKIKKVKKELDQHPKI